ncbi:TrmB family transcriptional regulator [Halobaculum sp. D14]|uniref:TrmB family transcriptional regulator n=1 Tax=unclassified Halobaculum TaxID=2640896 RepID=UPI003EBC88B1
MDQIELTDSQRELLAALVDRYQTSESPVTGEVLAEDVDRNPGTIRNQMQSLKALNLVEGIPGPKGGYKATANAYNVLDYQSLENPETVMLAREYDHVDVTVDEIDFTNVHDPDECEARLHFEEPVEQFDEGDAILVGPTPISKLVLGGVVQSVDAAANEVVVDVASLEAPLDEA